MTILMLLLFFQHKVETPIYWAITVENMETCSSWYQNVFELQERQRFEADDGTWVIQNLRNPSFHVELIQDKRSSKAGKVQGFRKVGFHVDDLQAWADKLESVTGEAPKIMHFEKMDQTFFQVKDPEGNTIQIFQARPD